MVKHAKCALLATLLASCGSIYPAPANPVRACVVPELPDAPILGVPCSDDPTEVRVCLTLDDAVALARWVARVVDIEAALAGCNLVRRVP
jgi:hypothetical protein